MNPRTKLVLAAAFALTAPWMAVWALADAFALAGLPAPPGVSELSTGPVVAVSGVAVLGASFLLAWGAETAEKDVPRAFAIAVLAVLAVAPEYAVDALYAWNAGALAGTPEGVEAGNLAVANMTGANRILIGIGWAGIALFTLFRTGADDDDAVERRSGFLSDAVSIDRNIGLDIVFLLAATLWAFLVPVSGGINALDMVVLVGLYVAYIGVILQGDIDPSEEHVGVPAALQRLPKPRRIATVVFLFAYSGLLIFTAVEPFAHGLEKIGQSAGIPSFFMIQWIAPLASESPELIVVIYLVNKARSTAGFNALISSKLNQWTLLIGTLVVVHSIALGRYGALGFDQKQAAEIWLTAAQSLFAISVLVNFRISGREAAVLLGLFSTQVGLEFLIIRDLFPFAASSVDLLLGFTAIYVLLAAGQFWYYRDATVRLFRQVATAVSTAFSDGETPSSAD